MRSTLAVLAVAAALVSGAFVARSAAPPGPSRSTAIARAWKASSIST